METSHCHRKDEVQIHIKVGLASSHRELVRVKKMKALMNINTIKRILINFSSWNEIFEKSSQLGFVKRIRTVTSFDIRLPTLKRYKR